MGGQEVPGPKVTINGYGFVSCIHLHPHHNYFWRINWEGPQWQQGILKVWVLLCLSSIQFSHLIMSKDFATPWTAACQASLSITNSWSLPKLMSIELVMASYHLILCYPLLLLPSNFPSIRVFSNESALCIRWTKYWSFSINISPSNEHPGLISFRMDWLDLHVYLRTWFGFEVFRRWGAMCLAKRGNVLM